MSPKHRRSGLLRASFCCAVSLAVVATLTACAEPAASDPTPTDAAQSTAQDASATDTTASQPDTTEPADTKPAVTGPTWHADVRPVVAKRCLSCHTAGGIGPFRLDRPADWASYAKVALHAIDSGKMPPFMADPTCGKFAEVKHITAAEKSVLHAWVTAGMPAGDPASAPKNTEEIKPFVPTHSAPMPQPYTPQAGLGDDYRCFLADLTFAKDMYLQASQVVPGTQGQVHHVLVYALQDEQITSAEKAAAASKQPGYACFGGPLPSGTGSSVLLDFAGGFPTQLAAWVPGMEPARRSADAAIRLPAGSRIVVQVHYNLTSANAKPDTTVLQMVLSATKPKRLVSTRPLLIHDIKIPAGEQTEHTRAFGYYGKEPLTIHSLTPHMHLLGSKFAAHVERKNATGGPAANECAVSVPDWDFAWQQSYARPADEPLVLQPGDKLSIACSYDNTAANQPVVGDAQLTPHDVKWGDGSLDEMCMLYLDMSHPYTDPPAATDAACAGFDACQARCKKDGNMDCLFACETVRAGCHTCAIQEVLGCAAAQCAVAMLQGQKCLTRCLIGGVILDSNPGLCLAAECATQYTAMRKCLDPKLGTGTCKQRLADKCGLSF